MAKAVRPGARGTATLRVCACGCPSVRGATHAVSHHFQIGVALGRQAPNLHAGQGCLSLAGVRRLRTGDRASGRRVVITRRRIKNDRLATASWIWAFASLTHSPGARAHDDRRRAAGDRHAAALRHLSNRFIGRLHHCVNRGKRYSEEVAWS